MNVQEIKQAVLSGRKVNWCNENYEVIVDKLGKWMVRCVVNDSYVGLTKRDGITLVGSEKDYKLKTKTMKTFKIIFLDIEENELFSKIDSFYDLQDAEKYAKNRLATTDNSYSFEIYEI